MACLGFFCAYLSVFVTGGVFGNPLAPFTPPAPSEGGKGEAQSDAGVGERVGEELAKKWARKLQPTGPRPVGSPFAKGEGGLKTTPTFEILNL